MRDVLSAAQAAIVLGCAPQRVREMVRIGEWPGEIIPKHKTGKSCDTFLINIYKLGQKFGISQEEIQRRLAEKKGGIS